MTEQDWDGCRDPQAMLNCLLGRVKDRRLRLFACACCRRVWSLLADEQVREAVEVAERYADGVGSKELEVAWMAAAYAADHAAEGSVESAVCGATDDDAWVGAREALAGVARAALRDSDGEQAAQCDLLRDIFGNPFRPVSIDPAWRTPAVVSLARAAYDERVLPSGHIEPERLAVLADALEDAGCTDPGILGHLRGPGVHFRGCHVLDLLLGRG